MDRMPTSDPPRLFDGRYELLGRLGAGGMATVWLAEDTSLHRKVAIKVLAERYAEDEQFVERFRREAQSAAGLNHPNIVAIYDRGVAEGTLLHRDGVPRGADPQGRDRRARRPRAEPRDRLRDADPRRAAVRPQPRRRAPRHQAAQRGGVARRATQGHRLRHRARRRLADDRGRLDRRHGAVPLARAGTGRGGRPAVRPLLGRDRAVRDAHGPGAVRGRLRRRDRDEAPRRGARAAERVRPRRAPRARAGRPARARQGRGRPLPDGRGDVGRPRPSASRRRAVAAYGADDARRAAPAPHRRYAGAASARGHSRVGPRAASGPAAGPAEGATTAPALAMDPRAPVAAGGRRGRRLRALGRRRWRQARDDRPDDGRGPERSGRQGSGHRAGRAHPPRAQVLDQGAVLIAGTGERPTRRPLRRLRGQGRLHGDAVRLDGPEARDRPLAQGDDRPAGDRRPDRTRVEVRRRDRHERPRDRGHGDQAGSRRREHRAEGLGRRRDGLERPEAGGGAGPSRSGPPDRQGEPRAGGTEGREHQPHVVDEPAGRDDHQHRPTR